MLLYRLLEFSLAHAVAARVDVVNCCCLLLLQQMQHACKRNIAAQALKYKGYAVHKPHEKFELWEYEPGPLAPNDIEIKVKNCAQSHTCKCSVSTGRDCMHCLSSSGNDQSNCAGLISEAALMIKLS